MAELKERIGELERELSEPAYGDMAQSTVFRPKIAEMSSEVRDDNPYSRLMALKKMGIVQDYEKIRTFRFVGFEIDLLSAKIVVKSIQ